MEKQVILNDLVGSIRQFGDYGAIYEILEVSNQLDDGDYIIKILVPETEEEARVKLSDIIGDKEIYKRT